MWHFFSIAGQVWTGRSYGGPEGELEANTPAGCRAHQCDAPELRALVDGELVDIAPRPSEFHDWNVAAQAWQDRRTLIELKAAAWLRLLAAKRQADAAGFALGGKTIQTDAEHVALLQAAAFDAREAKAASEAFSFTWLFEGGTEATYNATQVIAAGRALSAFLRGNADRLRARRAAIQAATSAAELDAVVW
ncbi:MAG TPA: DUF4376 domain-containing protein [Burkholderiaceae bacterium]|nr:DUF4376 domain-containing protein [Burkholderiaceae bacterium]